MSLEEDFKSYLTRWCKEHHKPRPEDGVMNKYWQEAWIDFMRTELTEKWEERITEFNNISLLTKSEEKRLNAQKKLDAALEDEEEPKEESKEGSSWERIKKYLK